MERNPEKKTVTLTWTELSEALSRAGILAGNEDINQLTLTKPRRLLIHTSVKKD